VGTTVDMISRGIAGMSPSANEAGRERNRFPSSTYSFFDGRPLLTVPTPRGKEERFLSIGSMEGKFFTVIWMWRDGTIRIVTARRARHAEEERYRALYG